MAQKFKARGDTRPTVSDKGLDALVKAAWDQNWGCQKAGNQHVKCYPPDGSRMVTIPSTPSDWRTIRNKTSAMRRGGLTGV